MSALRTLFSIGVVRVAILSAVYYSALIVLTFLGLAALSRVVGVVGVMRNPLRLGVFFGVLWLVGYCLAWIGIEH
jgi:hypothetical protein